MKKTKRENENKKRRKLVWTKHALAFSLIELLVTLVAISSVTSAVAPILSRNISGPMLGISGSYGNNRLNCPINNCLVCNTKSNGTVCLSCSNTCAAGSILNVDDCSCNSIPQGYYSEDGKSMTLCPKGHSCAGGSNNPIPCPLGTHSSYSVSVNGSNTFLVAQCVNCPKNPSNGNSNSYTAVTNKKGQTECTLCSEIWGEGCSKCSTSACTAVQDSNQYNIQSGYAVSKYTLKDVSNSISSIARTVRDYGN